VRPVALSGKPAADLLAQRTGLPGVAVADLKVLVERGHVRVLSPGSSPMYCLADLERFAATDELAEVMAERRTWWEASLGNWDAARAAGLSEGEFDAAVARGTIAPGRFGRFCRKEVEALAALVRRVDAASASPPRLGMGVPSEPRCDTR